ncbi:MAG: biopolymer transporter ExbD [Candidatus Omnitrophica bacterium]|nr:biopolymer transporter ExbD [Candidatus Omnitrophota bacterium]
MNAQKARVEMIPLMDCMFLLLCFFIYVTMSMVVQRGIFVNLAKAQTGESLKEEKKESLYLTVNQEGKVFADKAPVSESELLQRLRQFRQQHKDGMVVLNADKGTTHEKVMGVLDFVRQNGIGEVVFTVEPESKP